MFYEIDFLFIDDRTGKIEIKKWRNYGERKNTKMLMGNNRLV